MKLTKSTRVNAVIFTDKKHEDVAVFSADLNLTFGEYLKRCKKPLYDGRGRAEFVPTSINQMLEFDFNFSHSARSCGKTLNLYHFEDARFKCSVVEIAA